MASKPKLTYFDLRGAGEPIRYVLAYANIDYEDERVSFGDWEKVKPTTPFGLLPLVEVDGHVINQSTPICRYFAKRAGVAGADDMEALRIDALADTVVDLRTAVGTYYWRTPEDKKPAEAERLKKENIPLYFSQFEKILKENNGYFVNGKLSYADIYFAATVPYFNSALKYDVTDGYPLVKALYEKVNNLPGIKEWISKRPDSIL